VVVDDVAADFGDGSSKSRHRDKCLASKKEEEDSSESSGLEVESAEIAVAGAVLDQPRSVRTRFGSRPPKEEEPDEDDNDSMAKTNMQPDSTAVELGGCIWRLYIY